MATKRNLLKIEDRISIPIMRELNPKATYIVSTFLDVKLSADEKQAAINRIELAFKTAGIPNVKVIPHQIMVFEIPEN